MRNYCYCDLLLLSKLLLLILYSSTWILYSTIVELILISYLANVLLLLALGDARSTWARSTWARGGGLGREEEDLGARAGGPGREEDLGARGGGPGRGDGKAGREEEDQGTATARLGAWRGPAATRLGAARRRGRAGDDGDQLLDTARRRRWQGWGRGYGDDARKKTTGSKFKIRA